MSVKGADNVDIGCGNAFGGDDDVVDDSVEKVRSLFRLHLWCRLQAMMCA